MTLEMLDELAEWWRAQLEADKATLKPGGPGWNDLLAKLAVIRRYEDESEMVRTWARRTEVRLDELGWVMRRLAFAMADRPGWIHAWRADGG